MPSRLQIHHTTGLCLAALLLTVLTTAAPAALITEDFAYTPGSGGGGVLQGNNGGAGFSTAWSGGTTRVYVRSGSLSYAGGGYAITQAVDSHKAGTGFNQSRGLYRDLSSPVTGEAWFSFLVENIASDAQVNPFVALQWNPGTSNTFLADNYIQFRDGAVNINYAGTLSSDVVTGLARDTTHLIVGRWVIGAGNDTLEVWVNPANLSALGAADFSAASADAMASLTRLGQMGLSTSTDNVQVFIDAIRVSDGNGSPAAARQDVTGVIPEPAGFALAAAGAPLVFRRRRA